MKKRPIKFIICLLLSLCLLTSCAGGCNIGELFGSIFNTITQVFTTISDNLSELTPSGTPSGSDPSGTPSGSDPSGSNPSGTTPTPDPTPDPDPDPTPDPPVIVEDQYVIDGDYIILGSYPQSKANSFLNAQLTMHYAGELPTSSDSKDWTRFNYYENGEENGLDAWYKDINYSGDKYRAVYFTEYRPNLASQVGSTTTSAQDDNGYSIASNHVYWFKFEPLRWRILSINDQTALLLCENIIDTQYFYPELSVRNDPTVYANNWEYSFIRSWLNNEFINCAFDENERLHLVSETISNEENTTAFSVNTMISNDTVDKVYLLSYADSINALYDFNTSFTQDALKTKSGTDYAKAMGLTDSVWWLRSPHLSINGVNKVYTDGKVNPEYCADANTLGGVVPMIKIML